MIRLPFWVCENTSCRERNSLERNTCKKCGNKKRIYNKKRQVYFEFCKRVLLDKISNENLRNRFFKDPKSFSESDMAQALDEPIDIHGIEGSYWPERAETMAGLLRLNNLQFCVEEVIKNKVEGDLIEAGVWRGGATIFMKLILNEYGIKDKIVYVADSFEGIPKPNEKEYPADKDDRLHTFENLKVSLDEVKNNFKKYEVYDDNVKFLKGWFKDTLTKSCFEKLSILRIDGDLYESTWIALNLYEKLSKGGFIIIDDYGALPACRNAVDDFRSQNNINESIYQIDWTGIYWQKNE